MATIVSSRSIRRRAVRGLPRLARWLDEAGLVALLVAMVALVALAGYEARAVEAVRGGGVVLVE